MNESRSRFGKKINGRAQGTGMFKWFMLLVYIVLCSYVFTGWFRWRKWMGIPHWKIVSIGIAFLLLLLASSIFLGKFLPQSEIQLKILQFGNYWIGFLIYVIDLVIAFSPCFQMVLDGRTIDPNKNRCDPTGSFCPWRKFPVYTIRSSTCEENQDIIS